MFVQQDDQLLDIRNNDSLKTTFETTILPMFWRKIKPEYTDLVIIALKTLLPYLASYLCKAGFFVMTATETKPQNRLEYEE